MNESELREQLVAAGLESIASQVVAAAIRCVRFGTTPAEEDDLPAGCSKIGGRPDLPDHIQWPMWNGDPLHFLAQLDLAELSRFPALQALPATGRLYFFYNADTQPWGFDPKDEGSWRVILDDGPKSGLAPRDPPESRATAVPFRLCKVAFREFLSIPSPADKRVWPDPLPEQVSDKYLDFWMASEGESEPSHQILGHAYEIQNPMELECQLVSHGLYLGDLLGYDDPRVKALEAGAKDWRLLFQLDYDDNAEMMWGDGGRLYFWIRDQDLRACNFDRVWMILQCG